MFKYWVVTMKRAYCSAIEYKNFAIILKCSDGMWRARGWSTHGFLTHGFNTRGACRHHFEATEELARDGVVVANVDIERLPEE